MILSRDYGTPKNEEMKIPHNTGGKILSENGTNDKKEGCCSIFEIQFPKVKKSEELRTVDT